MSKNRDPAGWVAYGRRAGRPKIGTEIRATIPAGQVARLDALAAAWNMKRQDVIRRAVAGFLQQHPPDAFGIGTGREPEDDDD